MTRAPVLFVVLLALAVPAAAQVSKPVSARAPEEAMGTSPTAAAPAPGPAKVAAPRAATLKALSVALAPPTGVHRMHGIKISRVEPTTVRGVQKAYTLDLEEPATGSRVRGWPFGGDFGVIILDAKLGGEAFELFEGRRENLALIEVEVMVNPFRTGSAYLGVVKRIEWFDDKGRSVGVARGR